VKEKHLLQAILMQMVKRSQQVQRLLQRLDRLREESQEFRRLPNR
jgi:hypothetical protein